MDADLFTDLAADPLPVRAGWRESVRQGWHRLRWPHWLTTLKARLAVGATAGLVAAVAGTVWLMSVHAERDLLAQAQAREQAEVQHTTAQVGQRLAGLQALLDHLAQRLDLALLADPPRLASQLETAALLGPHFSSVYAAAVDGRVLALVDTGGARYPGLSLADRDDFRRAVASGRAVISPPVKGRISGEPVVLFFRPVVRNGGLVAVLGGSLRLASRDLASDLTGSAGSEDGALLVITDRAGTVLAHPERRFVNRPMTDDPALALAWQQHRGDRTGPWTVDGHVVATAVDPASGWQVWRLVPQATLLAPLRHARVLALRDAGLLVAAASALIVGLLFWQFRPLARLERRAQALLTGDATGEWPQAQGEIGRLARTLQHVWAERAQMEEFNQQVLQKLGSVMAAAPVGLAFTRNQRFELVSAEFCHPLGYAEADILGQSAQVIFASADDHAQIGARVGEAFTQGQPYSGEWTLQHADGSRFWGLLRARPVQGGHPAAGTIWSINDVSDQVRSRRELEHAARHDALTGVVNRKGFEHAVQDLFDQQPASRPAALVMIDLDHFKPINDTAGHAAGDAMLVAVAQAIAIRVRASDLVVRLGGDEFALLLPGCTHERAVAVAEKVREAITDLALRWEAHTLRVGASLGVCELSEHHDSPAQWLAQADAACYEAKRSGRGTVRLARVALRAVASAG